MFGGEFQIYKSTNNGKWYWRLKAKNNEILCSSQGFVSKQGAKRGVSAVRRTAVFARVRYP